MDHKLNEAFNRVQPALESKAEEFAFYGYSHITETQLWHYFIEKKWRRKNPADMYTHEMIADIFSLTAAQFMTHTHTEAQRNSEELPELTEEEREVLFSPKKKT